MGMSTTPDRLPRIVVVGPCASGKTTLVAHLQEAGYDARVVAQEHSVIADLWAKRNPDIVIALDLDLSTLRARRGRDWSAEVFAQQRRRLAPAFAAADLVIDTAAHTIDEVVGMVLEMLRER